MPDNINVNSEELNEVILRSLKLSANAVLSYQQYFNILKKKISMSNMAGGSLPREEEEILRQELLRVFKLGTEGRKKKFKIKSKKVKVSNKKTKEKAPTKEDQKQRRTDGGGALVKSEKKPAFVQKFVPTKKEDDAVKQSLDDIQSSLDSIANILSKEYKNQRKIDELGRRKKENERRKKKEELLEGATKPVINAVKRFLSPLKSFWDKLINFITYTLLGRAFNMFLEWSSKPENKEKLKSLGNFLKTWWPTLLGAFVLFATPLGGFIRSVVGTVAKLTLQLSKFAIPKLLRFMTSPAGIALGLATAGAWVPAVAPQTVNEQERRTDTAKGSKEDKIKQLETQKSNLNWFEKLQGKGSEIDEQLYHLKTGKTKSYGGLFGHAFGGTLGWYSGYKKGGIPSFSGVVNHKTGKTVSGAGPDTQMLPMQDGGAVVLQRGETVLQVGAREKIIKEKGFDPLEYNVGTNANKPRKISSKIFKASGGGILGYANGGVIGGKPDFWKLAALASKEDSLHPQGQADVAQAIYNRSVAGSYPGGKSIGNIVTAPGQFAPTFGNPSVWKSIVDKSSAIAAVGNADKLNMAVKSITNPSLQQNAKSFVGGRTDFMGESQKPYMKPGDVTRGRGYNFHGWFYDTKLKNPAPIPDIIKSQQKTTDSKPKPKQEQEPNIFQKISSGIQSMFGGQKKKDGGLVGNSAKFLSDIGTSKGMQWKGQESAIQKLLGISIPKSNGKSFSGLIKENSGMDIPGAGRDRQHLDGEPGEYVLTKRVVDEIGVNNLDRLVAMIDKNSSAAKRGKTIPGPPVEDNMSNNIITLPPIVRSSADMSVKSSRDRRAPRFSATSGIRDRVKKDIANRYGIVHTF
jgi:hypothetical protein